MEKKRISRSSPSGVFRKKEKSEPQGLIVYGVHAVLSALKMGGVREAWFQKGLESAPLRNIREQISEAQVQFVPKEELERLSGGGNHQGVVAFLAQASLYRELSTLKEGRLVLVLDHLQDPQNLGAILRSAELFGVCGVVIPKHRGAGLSSGVLKASSGAALLVPVVQHSSLIFVLEKLKSWGYWIYAADVRAPQALGEVSWPAKVVLIMGNESRGVSETLRKQADELFSIPTRVSRVVDSLNVSVATGICLHEIARHLQK